MVQHSVGEALVASAIFVYIVGVLATIFSLLLMGILQLLADNKSTVWWMDPKLTFVFISISMHSWLWFTSKSAAKTFQAIVTYSKIIIKK